MTPHLIVRTFGAGMQGEWRRMADVLRHSADEHCPDWIRDIQDVKPTETLSSPLGSQGTVWNTYKLDAWGETVAGLPDGARVLLMDADTLVVRPLDVVWQEPFDLAYTIKPRWHVVNEDGSRDARFPFNGGVIFLRVSRKVRQFLDRWRAENRRMLDDARYYQTWRRKYGGVNQSALGAILKQQAHGLHLRKLPCLEWNCEDEHWAAFDPALTRIVHYKGDLRVATLKPNWIGVLVDQLATRSGKSPDECRTVARELVRVWRSRDQQCSAKVPA